jgi:peptide-methionine (S)-S-oxide reductase
VTRIPGGGVVACAGLIAVAVLALPHRSGPAHATPLPVAVIDAPAAPAAGQEVAVFSGGCFWGIEAVFEHVKGVTHAESGYAGGAASTASYEAVSTGTTGHAESVRVVFDPSQVTYGQLLQVFFSVAHDPTELNYQGPDHGTQYRSAIWYTSETQKRIAEAYIAQLGRSKAFPRPIVTEVKPLRGFYLAEAYHQDYATHHPDQPYIVYNDAPKVEHLRKDLPALYRSARSS